MSVFKNSLHHSFDIDLAEKYGIPEAILIHHFQHWITINKRLKRNFHEGRTWTYQTLEEIAAHFPYFSTSQVNRLLRKLTKLKVLKKGNFNKRKFDRTVWYAFFVEENFVDRQMHLAKSPNGDGEIATPIPDTKTDTETKEKIYKKEKTKYLDFIFLSDDEHQKLLKKHGKENLDKILKILNNYKGSSGKKYKSDYFAIKNWVEDKLLEKNNTLSTASTNDLKKIYPIYERYVSWYKSLSDPFYLNQGFLILEKDCFYKKGEESYKYKIDYSKFIELLENQLHVPSRILRGDK